MHKTFPQLFLTIILTFLTITAAKAADIPPKGSIKGHIYTSDQKPAENVTVALLGTKHGTMTNDNGYFELSAPAGNYTLVISHVGIPNVTQPIEIKAGQSITLTDIILSTSQTALNEVQINGVKTNHFTTKKSYDVGKMQLKDLENSQSYTAVTKELLQEQAIYTADAAIKNVPGISTLWGANGRAGDGGAYFSLRGFSTAASLWNGVSGTVSNAIDATNLEAVEVIKGPSATLYGSTLTSFGGLINRVTKKPYENFGGNISYSVGSYSFNRASLDLNTPLNSAKKALLRINTSYNSTNSFQDNGFDRRFVFAPSFSYKVNDKLSFQFEAEVLHARGTTPQIMYLDYNTTVAGLGVNRADQLSVDYKKSYMSNDIVSTSDNVNFFGQAEYKFSDQWTSKTTVATNYSSSDGPQTYFYLLAGNNSLARMAWAVDGNSTATQIQQNFNGDFKIGGLRNRLVLGIDFVNQRSNITFSNFTSDASTGFSSALFDVVNTTGAIANYSNFNLNNVQSLFLNNTPAAPYLSIANKYTTSAYASDVLSITDNLLASFALRVDHFKNNPVYSATTDNYTAPGLSHTAVSPKFGLVYQVIKNQLSLFGNYQNGFVNPGYYSAFDATAPGGLVNKTAKVERANQAEGGVKLDLFNGKLNGTVSYYNIRVSDILRSDPSHPNAQSQDGTQVSKGFEAELIANPIDGLNLIAGYSFNDSKLTRSTAGYDEGYRPATAGSPRQVNFFASYHLTQGVAQGLGINFGGNYASDNKIVNNAYSGTFILPAYTVLNSGIFYEQRKFRLGLNVNNLTNKKYWIGYTTVNPQMLRQYIGTVTFKF